MYIRATDFLSLKSKIPESVHGKKLSGSPSIKMTNSYIYVHISFYCKNNFFQWFKVF